MEILKILEQSVAKIRHTEAKNEDAYFDPAILEKYVALDEPLKKQDQENLIECIQKIISLTPSTARKDFFNLLYGGRNEIAVIADMLTSYMNLSMHTYKTAGVQIIIENELIKKVCKLIGFHSNSGLFLPGGALSNLVAICAARNRFFPQAKEDGIYQYKPIIYTSETAHYSIQKSAQILGFGRNAVKTIECDQLGRMKPDQLEAEIIKDKNASHPFFINATAGSTVLGAYDQFDTIASIAKKHQLWLHVDGAFGLTALFAKNKNTYLQGIEKADSISWDAHKMLCIPLLCSMILFRDNNILKPTFSETADYLFQSDLNYNPGSYHLQCGRRNDAFKLWLYWKWLGEKGLQERFEKLLSIAQRAKELIQEKEGFHLFQKPQSVNVCFNYKDILAEDIVEKLYKNSLAKISHGCFQKKSFLRLSCVNPEIDQDDIINLLNKIVTLYSK